MSAVIVTVVLAFVGYIVTYTNNVRLSQRQERLARINRQLSELYGPLFSISEAHSRTFAEFRRRHSRNGVSPFADETPPTAEELTEWRLWVTSVFLPTLRSMRDLVVQNADLLIEPEVPEVLLQLCAHVSGYEITVARWEQGDHSEHLSIVHYPADELAAYINRSFTLLKAAQARLLGRRRLRRLLQT
ncbi:hypothetical protein [Amycolatopsis sp. NPDC006125]|uniref:hypothetical protein n=1 Tax=Amycolatopsis sp. NPDC006125 TaxID=3156730 RepID=UPI0033A85AE6